MRGRWIGWGVFLLIVGVVIGLAVVGNTRTNSLLSRAIDGSGEARVGAVRELAARDDFYDLLQSRTPEERIKLADGVEAVSDEAALKMAIKMSRDPERAVRERYAITLIRIGAKYPIVLADGLKEGDSNIKSNVSIAMVGLGKPSIPLAVERVKIADSRGAAGDVLVRLCVQGQVLPTGMPDSGVSLAPAAECRDQAVPSLVPLVNDKDDAIKMFVMESLSKIRDFRATGPIAAHLSDPLKVRRVCLTSLGAIAAPESESILVEAVLNPEEDSDARASCAAGLGRIASPTAVRTLVKALGDLDLRVRTASVAALQRAGDRATPALAAVASGADPVLRAYAVSALAGTSNPLARRVLATAVSDPDTRVRLAAVNAAIGSVERQSASESWQIALLVSALDDKDGGVASAASKQLARVGRDAVVPLSRALDSGSDVARYFAAKALGEIGSAAIPTLTHRLDNRWAIFALGQIADSSVKPILERVAASQDPDLRYIAAQALATAFNQTSPPAGH